MTTRTPKNLKDVRDTLGEIASAVLDDRRMVPQAKEASNALGKMTNTVKSYLEACKIAGVKPSFDENWNNFIFGTND